MWKSQIIFRGVIITKLSFIEKQLETNTCMLKKSESVETKAWPFKLYIKDQLKSLQFRRL